MGKIKLPVPKSRWARSVLIVLGTIGLIALAAAAWEVLFVCALWAAAFWILRRTWRWLDRRLRLSQKFKALCARLKGMRRVFKILLILAMIPAAAVIFVACMPVSLICLAAAGVVWGASVLWKKLKPRLARSKSQIRLCDLSIQVSYVLYVVVAMVAATVICAVLINAVDHVKTSMYLRYADQRQTHFIPKGGEIQRTEDDESVTFVILDAANQPVERFKVDPDRYRVELGYDPSYALEYSVGTSSSIGVNWYETYNIIYVEPIYTDSDHFLDRFLGVVSVLCIPVVYVSAITFCAMMFFKKKLREPIGILTSATGRIAENSLDFHVTYGPRDEMGRLCDSFEKMRAALETNNAEMWRQMEERRRLNAAFSHDLRTPLTVLKGHAELLKSEIPDETISRQEILQEVDAMSAHIGRLEKYVGAMSRLQRLEDVEIHIEPVPAMAFAESLKESAEILCGEKAMGFAASPGLVWNVDPEVVTQVFENLMSNAVRYAESWVKVRLEQRENDLLLTVSDDGPGFSNQGLEKATEPFYRADNSTEGHLGLGLNICRVLCERHGGGVKVENAPEGGARVLAWFATGREGNF